MVRVDFKELWARDVPRVSPVVVSRPVTNVIEALVTKDVIPDKLYPLVVLVL
jgi:hypothetical protein